MAKQKARKKEAKLKLSLAPEANSPEDEDAVVEEILEAALEFSAGTDAPLLESLGTFHG